MNQITISVEGMSCGHCKAAVEGVLGKLEGVSSAEVNLASKNVTVQFDSSKVSEDKLKNEIEEAGYDVV
ncbi:copper resistance protein CopZ [Anaerobacillus alkalilacustris]|uniref:Copper chaperone CopZ n=1 Tax=Anaerobacillus alkalilacustris TaxID=393763 RepID=A0A1S2LL02_9BACI|nr:copper chaperone CopZ [Anaerobacillus alkalilacustris]OIJ13066.1 copper resistance protein CopZ [Anaerobacillus alkalilacustris]